ncbi:MULTISPECIES: YjcZ family sporulation protein [unclassified Lysinibacillus]|nr:MULTISPECIES: YjcZ family sporulation protein [unclassified Lysinibacillus]MDD1504090.1 YjcZ family sporulation protein [Lysinibacillus sp. CNPSo 3705]UPW81454.1 YjcZ family sporulation protein [Lysinibacillus sp. Ag94]
MGYYGNVGGINSGCYYGGGYGSGSSFALIVVLFILLIIIGATFLNREY